MINLKSFQYPYEVDYVTVSHLIQAQLDAGTGGTVALDMLLRQLTLQRVRFQFSMVWYRRMNGDETMKV